MDIPFHKASIGDDEIAAVVATLKSGWLTTGPRGVEFESEFAKSVGAKHAVALNSCTAALHLALEALGTGSRDCIITTPMTFAATAEVAYYLGAEPVFVDIEPDTMNIDATKIEQAVNAARSRGLTPRAIVPVHYAGLPCDMDAILDVAGKNGLKVVEDAAHAYPAKYKGRAIGCIGDVTCFSFYATKTMTTGEGGMVTTNDRSVAERIRKMSLHGISKDAWKRYSSEGNWYYEIEAPGYKYNMTDIAASIGLVQLIRSREMMQARAAIAARYDELLADVEGVELPVRNDLHEHSWHLYVIKLRLDRINIGRAEFISELKARGVGTSVHFIPLHLHPYYRDRYGYKADDFPVAGSMYERIVSLPIYPSMSEEEVCYVARTVKEVCAAHSK